jgi:hypothetical protein
VQKGTGLDIEIDGVNAMLVALYIPNQPIAFVRDAAYYPPTASSFNKKIIHRADLVNSERNNAVYLNTKYALVMVNE